MARSQSQSSQREGGEATGGGGAVRRQSPRKSVTGGSAPVLSGGYLQRHTSKVRICFVLAFSFRDQDRCDCRTNEYIYTTMVVDELEEREAVVG
jgi:hypothetical protein